jgi:hypothetical protein
MDDLLFRPVDVVMDQEFDCEKPAGKHRAAARKKQKNGRRQKDMDKRVEQATRRTVDTLLPVDRLGLQKEIGNGMLGQKVGHSRKRRVYG